MGFVLLFFGVALLIAAWRANDRTTRLAMLGFALLNWLALADMLRTRHPHTWRLAPPSVEPADPPWRR